MSNRTCPTCGLEPDEHLCPDPCHRDRAKALRDALEKAQSAIWDAHYGKGIAIKYVRAVDKEIRDALEE